MRLFEIMETPPPVRGRLTDEELRVAYDKLIRNEMSKEEIADFARDMVEKGEYPRTVGSLIFVLSRMHIILHGIAPEGETQNRADIMFRDTRPIIDYVLRRGDLDEEDIQYHLGHAREELASRPSPRAKIRPEDARKMMSDYYRNNRNMMPKNITQYREQIIQDILNGVPVEQAFSKYI